MKRHRATTSCPGTGPPRGDRPCDGVERFCWQPDFYRIAILLWLERYHPELLLPGLRDEIARFFDSVNRDRNRADRADALGADRIPLEDVLRALAEIDVPLMAVATVIGTGLPDGAPFDPDRFRDEARILDWEAGITILPAGQAAADELARVIASRERSG